MQLIPMVSMDKWLSDHDLVIASEGARWRDVDRKVGMGNHVEARAD